MLLLLLLFVPNGSNGSRQLFDGAERSLLVSSSSIQSNSGMCGRIYNVKEAVSEQNGFSVLETKFIVGNFNFIYRLL